MARSFSRPPSSNRNMKSKNSFTFGTIPAISKSPPGGLRVVFVSICTALLFFPSSLPALIQVGRGNAPVQDNGWPDGALEVANLKSRVGWWEGPPFGGGEHQFLYRGDTTTFQQALDAFAAIRAPALDLVVHDGPHESPFLKLGEDTKTETRVDWTFTVWRPESWHRLFNNPKLIFYEKSPNFRKPVDPPRLDVYIYGGQVEWAKVKVPANVRLRDERASALGADLSDGSMIQADIFEMETGRPVYGARLLVEKISRQPGPDSPVLKERIAEAVAGASGRIQVSKVPADRIRVSVTAEGYAARRLDERLLNRPEFLKFVVELAKVASVTGIVTDTQGHPIKGAKVRTATELGLNGLGYDDGRHYEPPDSWSVATDAAGRFELKGLPTGFAQLFVSMAGYYFGDVHTIHDVPGTNVVLRLVGAGSIHITVTDKDDQAISRFEGNPLIVEVEPKEGWKIGVSSWGGSANIRDDGTFDFTGVPPGEYRVSSRPNPGSSRRNYPEAQIVIVEFGKTAKVKLVYR